MKNPFIKGLCAFLCLFTCYSSFSFVRPHDYVHLSANEKRELLWEKGILATEFKKLPPYDNINIFKLFFLALNKKMDYQSDFRPKKWSKPIHRRSVVAKVRYVSLKGHKYTGLFSSGALGFVRVSLTYRPDKRGVAPGIALKFFVDGNSSRDVSLLTGLNSQGQDYNFF